MSQTKDRSGIYHGGTKITTIIERKDAKGNTVQAQPLEVTVIDVSPEAFAQAGAYMADQFAQAEKAFDEAVAAAKTAELDAAGAGETQESHPAGQVDVAKAFGTRAARTTEAAIAKNGKQPAEKTVSQELAAA